MRQTRRTFLKSMGALTAIGIASPTLISRSALAQGNVPGANERIGIAGIGVGRRGSEVFAEAANNPKTQPICVADIWLPRAETVAKKNGCSNAYQDYRRVLDNKDVDAVISATPEHWRGLTCIGACQAGKHVYAEKPVSLTISEGRKMVQAARKYNVVFQTGSQQRSQRENFIGCEFIRNGGLGEIQEVIAANYESPWLADLPAQPVLEGLDWDFWCGPTEPVPFNMDLFAPRAKPGWLSFRPYSGGEMTGWGTHGFDQIQCALGMELTGPTEILVDGEKLEPPIYSEPETAERGNKICSKPHLSFRYANGITVKLENANRGGGIFIGKKAKMEIFRGNLTSNPKELALDLLKNHSRQNQSHVDNWLFCILSGERPISDIEIGHRSASVCHLLNIARYLGRSLKWNPEKELFVGDDEANQWLERPARKGFELPDQV
ncbi:MAG: Gfo/Idh/MocA family oxidoreductase [Planctomycetia bacterium]|nr:Gfo/Idh/MocA family oxidoreductase [Planctomycetia bacterium]